MVWGAYHHGVNVLADLVEKLTKIIELLGRRPLAGLFSQPGVVNIADSNDLTEIGRLIDITRTFATHTNSRKVQGFIGLAAHPGGRKGRCREKITESCARCAQEPATIHCV